MGQRNRREPLLVDTRLDEEDSNHSGTSSSSRSSLRDDYDRDVPEYEPPSLEDLDSGDGSSSYNGNDRYRLDDDKEGDDDDHAIVFQSEDENENDDEEELESEDSVENARAEMSFESTAANAQNEEYSQYTNFPRRPMQDRISSHRDGGGSITQGVAQSMTPPSDTQSVFARQPPRGGDEDSVQNSVHAFQSELRYGGLIEPRPSGSASIQTSGFYHDHRHYHHRQTGDQPPMRHEFDGEDVLSAMSTNTYTVGDQTTFLSTEADTMITRDEEIGEDTSMYTQRKMFSDVETLSGRFGLMMSGDEGPELMSTSEDGIILVKQRVAYMCIILTAVQLGILLIQLTLCGLASVKINPLLGPYPDAFSEWGGKNAYLLVEGEQYFRLITPALLHVGILHLIVNAYCQLETCAYLEREWGSSQWIVIYFVSAVGTCLTASTIDPDTIGVLSSGPLMGIFGAKIAQTITWSFFELQNSVLEHSVHYEHLGGVMCSAATVSLMSFFTYIDWSGHLGGLVSGFLVGMAIFAGQMKSLILKLIWILLALAGMTAGATLLAKRLFLATAPDEDLADACQYFRNLYPEGYDCECVWE
jgi:membrane associated rhomboid family serine protease